MTGDLGTGEAHVTAVKNLSTEAAAYREAIDGVGATPKVEGAAAGAPIPPVEVAATATAEAGTHAAPVEGDPAVAAEAIAGGASKVEAAAGAPAAGATEAIAAEGKGMFAKFNPANVAKTWKGSSGILKVGRVAGIGVGVAMTADAFRSKTSEGKDRSFVVRLGEGAAGVTLAGASLAAGGRG